VEVMHVVIQKVFLETKWCVDYGEIFLHQKRNKSSQMKSEYDGIWMEFRDHTIEYSEIFCRVNRFEVKSGEAVG
jgi:hypothetical protein